jgi:ribosomal protein S18 acetylase RimI-like enzyme
MLEELSLNAWPALQNVVYDGWILRFAEGYTRRANSINPIYASTLPVDDKIAHCEALYRAKQLPTVFKLTAESNPAALDERLAARGYAKEARTRVMALTIDAPIAVPFEHVVLEGQYSERWLQDYCRLSGRSTSYLPTMRRMLDNLVDRAIFASLPIDGQTVALGMGVVAQGYVGLFDIATAEAFRRRGFASELIQAILAWAQTNGANYSYLQVMCDNLPALRLYEKFGYCEQYQYWYRVEG